MNAIAADKIETLSACIGNYPHTKALKSGDIKSDRVAMNFTEVNPVNRAFLMMVRELKFDVCEMAIVTYLQAKAYGKPLMLLPATMLGRFQQSALLYNSERGPLQVEDLPGRRVGVRAFSQTTGVWIRGILWKDYGLDLSKVNWVTFEDAHVAEYRDPPGSGACGCGQRHHQDAARRRTRRRDFRRRDADRSAIEECDCRSPKGRGKTGTQKYRTVPINHMIVVKDSLSKSNPAAVREIYRMLLASKTGCGPAESRRDRLRAVRLRCGQNLRLN